MKRWSIDEQTILLKVLRERIPYFYNYPSAHYWDVGYRFRNGKPTSTPAIRAFVIQKLLPEQLRPTQIIPRELSGFPVDVIQGRPIHHRTSQSRHDPLQAGVAIANIRLNGQGTLGAIVFDRVTQTPMGLSAHHVLVGESGQSGDLVTQPASQNNSDVVGRLVRWDHAMDCAVFAVNGSRSISQRLLGASTEITGTKEPEVGMRVMKSGMKTGVTYGIIDGINDDGFTIIPDFAHPAPDGEISSPGDSGAVWVEFKTGLAVGLHVAGETDPDPAAERAWAKRINKVLQALHISIGSEHQALARVVWA